jgi:sialate O-acetylesterase
MAKSRLYHMVLLVVCLLAINCFADVKLPSVISDHMVLQQQSEAAVWGWADVGEKVIVKPSWHRFGVTTKADANGVWKTKLKTPKAGGPFTIRIIGKNEIVLNDILVGEVWVCSGQSNMQWSLNRSDHGAEEIAAAENDNIRLFLVPMASSPMPQSDCDARWTKCNSETASPFSGVGYLYGKLLEKKLNVPVGLIGTYWGGSSAEAWMSDETLRADEDYKEILARERVHQETFSEQMTTYVSLFQKWQQDVKAAKQAGKAAPRAPRKPRQYANGTPAGLYNAMIKPILGYGIRGVIWYQGEANRSRAYQYRKLFPAMITTWREDWGVGDFPFYFAQIAPYKYRGVDLSDSAELREAQMMTLTLKNTGMAVTMDIGNVTNIHPTNKHDVAKRLSLWAFSKDYGFKDIVYSGPLYKKMKVEGNKIRLMFDHVGSGLVLKDDKGFKIAAADEKFVDAKAVVDGDTIVVSSDQVANPVAVRYAFTNGSEASLFNKEQLPASSFRTDTWPGVTFGEN